MSRTLSKAWWLLALCGILDAMHASINLLMRNLPLTYRIFGSNVGAVWYMGLLALLAGTCTIAAGLWSGGKDQSWLLSLHGVALGTLGAIIFSPANGALSFRPVSLLFAVTAASIGGFALANAGAQGRSTTDRWFLIASGTISIAFAFSFVAVGFLRIIGPVEPQIFFSWLSAYFVLCAVFMLWLAFRVHSRSVGQAGGTGPFSPAPIPMHTH